MPAACLADAGQNWSSSGARESRHAWSDKHARAPFCETGHQQKFRWWGAAKADALVYFHVAIFFVCRPVFRLLELFFWTVQHQGVLPWIRINDPCGAVLNKLELFSVFLFATAKVVLITAIIPCYFFSFFYHSPADLIHDFHIFTCSCRCESTPN